MEPKSREIESEFIQTISNAFAKYKKFAFNIFSKIPYSSIPLWIDFADGNISSALKEERSIVQNLKDAYALSLLSILIVSLSFWYVIGALLYFLVPSMVFLGLMLQAVGASLTGVLSTALFFALLLLALFILSPLYSFLFRALIYYIPAKLLGGAGTYRKTLTALTLSASSFWIISTPLFFSYAVLIGFVLGPLIYVFLAYSFYLLYKSIGEVHKLGFKRALGAFAVGIALDFIIPFAAAILLLKFIAQ